MSSLPYDSVEKPALQASLTSDAWTQDIVPGLPEGLEEHAWLLGAMSRKKGKLQSASDLLRGILAYVLCVTSFRALGAWGVLAGVADMADTSWRDRLRKSSDWLGWLLNELIRPERLKACPSLKKAGYGPIELVDASHLKCVGKHGKTWRFHCMYALLTQQVHQSIVSSARVAESVAHFCLQAGAVYVHDSGYGYRNQVAHAQEAEAYTVTAFYPGSFPLEDEAGKTVEVVKWLKKQRATSGAIRSLRAWFWESGKRYEVRVIGLRRTPEHTQKELGRKKKQAKRDKRTLQKETMYLAGWVLVLTTLPAKDWSNQEVLSVYRARWQIEMLFKRIKQLLKQHILRAETDETAKASLSAILVSWVLQQEVATELRTVVENMYSEITEQEAGQQAKECGEEEQVISEWMVQTISVALLRQQVQGSWSRQRMRECVPRLRRHLGERPRKRSHQWQRVHHWLTDAQTRGHAPGGGESRHDVLALSTALA